MAAFGNSLRNRRFQVRILSRVFVSPYKASHLRLALLLVENRLGLSGLADRPITSTTSASPRETLAGPPPSQHPRPGAGPAGRRLAVIGVRPRQLAGRTRKRWLCRLAGWNWGRIREDRSRHHDEPSRVPRVGRMSGVRCIHRSTVAEQQRPSCAHHVKGLCDAHALPHGAEHIQS